MDNAKKELKILARIDKIIKEHKDMVNLHKDYK